MKKTHTTLKEPILGTCNRLRNCIAILLCVNLAFVLPSSYLLLKNESNLAPFILLTTFVSLFLLNGFRHRIPNTEEKLWRFRKSDASTMPLALLLCLPLQLLAVSFFLFMGIFSTGTFWSYVLFITSFLFVGSAIIFLVRFITWRQVLLSEKDKKTILCNFQKSSKNITLFLWLLAVLLLARKALVSIEPSTQLPNIFSHVYYLFPLIGLSILFLSFLPMSIKKSQNITKNRYFFNAIVSFVCADFVLNVCYLFMDHSFSFFEIFERVFIITLTVFEGALLYRLFRIHIAQTHELVVKWKNTIAGFLQRNFASDPLFANAFGNDEKGTEAMQRYFYYTVDYCDHYGRVNIDANIDAVLAWIPIDYFPPQPDNSLLEFYPEAIHRFEKHEQTPESIIDENGNDYGYIWALAVSPEKRKNGLASRMISKAIAQMKNWDLTECWLTTEAVENQNFYQKNGFTLFEKSLTELELTTFVFRKNLHNEK